MRRFLLVGFSIWFAISMTLADISIAVAQTSSTYPDSTLRSDSAAGYTPDQSESQALTDYLTKRRLPLVGAQVLRASDGQRMVVLYGFVGSDFGKSDAVKKARRFLRSSSVRVDNHINVRPELLASNRSGSAAASPGSSYSSTGEPGSSADVPDTEGSSRSADDYASKYPGADSYTAQRPNATVQQLSSIAPMIALLGVLGMALAGSHGGLSFGGSSPFGSSPFGSSPYGYGSPYSSPYGSPYGGSPYGGSPYGSPYGGGSPYGSSPYGSSPYGSGTYP